MSKAERNLPSRVDDSQAALPRYRLKWSVGAVKIESAAADPMGYVLTLEGGFAPHFVPTSVVRPGTVAKGDYLVILMDGTRIIRSESEFLKEYEPQGGPHLAEGK